MKTLHNHRGHTLIEVLVALFLTGIISMAGLQFYVDTHNQALAQEDVGDLQNVARATLDEIARNLRQAGYKIGAHAPYALAGDTLFVYYSDTQAVDTVAYYLQKRDYARQGAQFPTADLMKRVNSNMSEVYTDKLATIRYTVISPSVIDVVVTATVDRADEDYSENHGVRTLTIAERVQMRNLTL